MKCPEPGLYSGVPFDEYCQWEAMNASTLCGAILGDGTVSFKHFKARLDGRIPRKNTKALADGRAIHSRLLEPKEFAKTYRISGSCVNLIKSGERAGQPCGCPGIAKGDAGWQCGKHWRGLKEDLPENVISAKMGAKLDRMVEEIRNHGVINLFRHSGGVEVSLVWDQEVMIPPRTDFERTRDFGVPIYDGGDTVRMKGRIDKLIMDSDKIPPSIVDLKKTARERHTNYKFGKAISDYKYDVKAAAYLSGLKSLTGKTVNFIWAAIEDDEPYDCNVIMADNETRAIGDYKFQRLLREYCKSMSSGNWTGVNDDISEGGLNEWAKRQHRRAMVKEQLRWDSP